MVVHFCSSRGLDLRDWCVQGVPDHHLHQPVHQFHLPHGHVGRQIHRRMPPNLKVRKVIGYGDLLVPSKVWALEALDCPSKPRIIYIRFNSKLPYLLHRIKNHNNEAANQKLFVETFGHLYEIYEASIDDATNKSASFWSFCELISTLFCLEWLQFCSVIRKGGCCRVMLANFVIFLHGCCLPVHSLFDINSEVKTFCGNLET